jgi:dihydroorotate dehydrogenase
MTTVLSTTLAGIPFPLCVMNAAGAWSGTHEELRGLAASATGAVVIKTSITQARMEFEPAIGGALDLIAVGGVANGQEAQGALSRGAKAVQIGSALMKEGPGVFARIQQELSAVRTMPETGA